MKKRVFILGLVAMLLSAGACGSKEPEATDLLETKENTEVLQEEGTAEASGEEEPTVEEETLSFAELKRQTFIFASGAGAWGTEVTIGEDGSFSGIYSDSDMGSSGSENPKGTVYRCDFTGRFTEPVKVNDYTYSMRITELTYEEEAGKEEYADGFRYVYSDAYGLDGAEEILIYLPGAPLAELPEAYLNWVGYYDLTKEEETELPFWGLYNEAQENGFYSYDSIEHAKEVVANTEEWAIAIEASIQNDTLTQADLNVNSGDLYSQWDYALNLVWDVLKQTLDEEAMETLTIEERAWIVDKEAAVSEAGAEFEGGSMYAMVVNQKAAELTRERVYELLELLE